MRKLILIILTFTLITPQPTYALRPISTSISSISISDLFPHEDRKSVEFLGRFSISRHSFQNLWEILKKHSAEQPKIYQLPEMPTAEQLRQLCDLPFEVDVLYTGSGHWLLVTGRESEIDYKKDHPAIWRLTEEGRVLICIHIHRGEKTVSYKASFEDIQYYTDYGNQNLIVSIHGITIVTGATTNPVSGEPLAQLMKNVPIQFFYWEWTDHAEGVDFAEYNTELFLKFLKAMGAKHTLIPWDYAEGITNCLMSLDLSYDPLSKLNSDILIERLQAEAFLQVRKAHQLKAYFDKMKELGKEVNMPQDRKQQAVYAVILSSA